MCLDAIDDLGIIAPKAIKPVWGAFNREESCFVVGLAVAVEHNNPRLPDLGVWFAVVCEAIDIDGGPGTANVWTSISRVANRSYRSAWSFSFAGFWKPTSRRPPPTRSARSSISWEMVTISAFFAEVKVVSLRCWRISW